MAASALLHPESRCQERYLTDQVAIYRRYAELVRREMDIKQSQVKKRYYQVFVKPNARRQQSRANDHEAVPTSQLLHAAGARMRPGAVGAGARRSQPPQPQRRRGAVDTTQPLTASLPSFIAPSRKAPRLFSQSAATAAADPLSSRVSALSLYTITARSRLRATRSASRRGRRCGGDGGGDDHDDGEDDDDSDGGGSVASASDFPALVYCIRRRLAKEASQQRRLAVRNTAVRRAQSAALEQNPLFAEEQCWRKGADGVIRRRAITNPLTSRRGAAAAASAVEEAANVARPGAIGASRGGRLQVSRNGDGGGAVTFLTELPRLPTAAAAAASARRPPQKQQSQRVRLGARAACEPLWPLIGSLA